MRTLVQLLVVATMFCRLTNLQAEDGLFSEVAMESVYEKNAPLTASVASLGSGEKLERITGASSLMLALKYAGYSPKQAGDQVTVQIEQAGWKLPVTLAVDLEQDRIICEMSLIDIPDSTKVESDAVLKLLEKSDTASGKFFAYDAKLKLIQLRSSFSNRSVTAKQLKINLTDIATFADKHSDLWSKLKTKAAASTTDASGKKTGSSATGSASATGSVTKGQPIAPANVTMKNLTGLWGSSLKGGESIAIQIVADNTFKLATVKAGKSSVSKGKATLIGNRLTLVGDDKVTLNCTIAQVTTTSFQLSINDQTGKAKSTIDFSKSK